MSKQILPENNTGVDMAKTVPVTSMRLEDAIKSELRLRGPLSTAVTNLIRRYLWAIDVGRRNLPALSGQTLTEIEQAYPVGGASQSWSISALRKHISDHISDPGDQEHFYAMQDIEWLAMLDCLDCFAQSRESGPVRHLSYWIERPSNV